MRLNRVLIANRGEIALRIIRSCHKLGLETVLAASEADLDSLPARLADSTICIGEAKPAMSYLDVEAVVGAALAAKADAIHPGYGFLSENVALVRRCRAAGLVFIGPTEEQLEGIGDKLKARGNALAARLPVVPGGPVNNVAEAMAKAEAIGWPILIKAVGGGGGRGIKQVHNPSQLAETIELAMAEASAAFGDARVYLERFVASGRHVEVQLLGDGQKVIHLGTRDCSVQRRYQKLVEEAPAPALTDGLRDAMHAAAVRFGEHMKYQGLGTVEFLVDCHRAEFYFLEMNARIQVEHPVTEAITGLDLVAEQFYVAEGYGLRLDQGDIAFTGHAVECRINAEDWTQDFRPSPGTVAIAMFPAGRGIRVDTHIERGMRVTPFYDSLLAKIVVHGEDRTEALRGMIAALANCHIEGVTTNVAMHEALFRHPEFSVGGVDTSYFARFLEQLEQ